MNSAFKRPSKPLPGPVPPKRRWIHGPGFVTRMILVTLFLLLLATLGSGAAAYVVTTTSIADEIRFAGENLVRGLAGSIVTIIMKEGAEGELQMALNRALAVDRQGRIVDAVILAKDLSVLAAKDPSTVGRKFSALSGLRESTGLKVVRTPGVGTRISAPVQWGREKKHTLGHVVITVGERAFSNARDRVLVTFSIILALTALVTIWMTRRILRRLLRPVVALGHAAQRMAQGDQEVTLEPRGNDEIAIATRSFLTMREAQGVFSRFSNPALVQEILSGRAPDQPVETRLAIGFGDGVHFTDWSQGRRAKEINSVLSDYFTLFGGMVVAHDGIIEKFMGDAVMTYFGLHQSPAAGSSQALRAHVTGQHLLRIANAAFEQHRKQLTLTFRFGVATGRCVVGPMGARKIKLDYTLIGDTVNLASRLEGVAEPGGLAIDRFTFINVSGPENLSCVGPLAKQIKGFSAPVAMYHVRGFRAADEVERLRQTVIDALHSDIFAEIVTLPGNELGSFRRAWETRLRSGELLLPTPVQVPSAER